MVVFITSIRHPLNSNNFRHVEQLFEISLRSVCAQSDPDFRVVVVCNGVPAVAFDDPRVRYHVVDFPPPSSMAAATIPREMMCRDKGTKLLSGMLLARRHFKPSHFFIFDADDLISHGVAAYVNAHPSADGWYVDRGYALHWVTKRIQRKRGLVRYCGTSLVPNADGLLRVCGVDESLTETTTQEQLIKSVPTRVLDDIFGNHQAMVGFCFDRGLRLQPLPIRGATYVAANGENQTLTSHDAGGIPITEAFRQEFGLSPSFASQDRASYADYVQEFFRSSLSELGWLRYRLSNGFRTASGELVKAQNRT